MVNALSRFIVLIRSPRNITGIMQIQKSEKKGEPLQSWAQLEPAWPSSWRRLLVLSGSWLVRRSYAGVCSRNGNQSVNWWWSVPIPCQGCQYSRSWSATLPVECSSITTSSVPFSMTCLVFRPEEAVPVLDLMDRWAVLIFQHDHYCCCS